jgi:hypothetical protein
MSNEATGAVWRHSKSKGKARLVLLAIADQTKRDGTGAWPSLSTIAAMAGIGRRSVPRIIDHLCLIGELRVISGGGPHRCNLYDVCLPNLLRDPDSDIAALCKTDSIVPSIPSDSDTTRAEMVPPFAPDPSDRSTYRDPVLQPHTRDTVVPLDAADLVVIWNQHKSNVQPECKTLSGERQRSARARLCEVRKYLAKLTTPNAPAESTERNWWIALVQKLAQSGWHNGQNERKWIADFDFLLRPQTWVRYVERTLGDATNGATIPTAEQRRQQIRNTNARALAKLPIYKPTWADDDDETGDAAK